jgi:hypothetical protein
MKLIKVKDGDVSRYSEFFRGIQIVTADKQPFQESVVVYGCIEGQEKQFYEAVLNLDEYESVHGFETIKDVERFWADGDMTLCLPAEDFEDIEEKSEAANETD